MTARIVAFTACVLTTCAGLAPAAQPPGPATPAVADERTAPDALQPPASPPVTAPPARPRPVKTPGATGQETPPPPPAAVVAATPREAHRQGQAVNVRVDVTITDQRGGAASLKKTVTVVTGDGLNGLIRSSASYAGGPGDVPLNVDTEPMILPDGKIRLRLNLQYDLPGANLAPAQPDASRTATPFRTSLHENLALILESGKAMIATQSADPVSDRQVTVEVKATVLR
jgi:hypothetical protein